MFEIKKDHLKIIFFLKAMKDLCFKQVHKHPRLEKNSWVILDFILNNSDNFRELIQNNTTHFFVRVHIKQY